MVKMATHAALNRFPTSQYHIKSVCRLLVCRNSQLPSCHIVNLCGTRRYYAVDISASNRLRRPRDGVQCESSHLNISNALISLKSSRAYSTDNDGENNPSELKGVVVHVPNPLLWIKNKWYSYLIRFSIDPAFNLEEFLTGAKQALSFLTRLIVQRDYETLKNVASVEAVETVRQLVEPWSLDQQHSIEVLVEHITLASASIASLSRQKDSNLVYVDVLCIAVKRYNSRPLLIQMTVRFHREYAKNKASDWSISSISEFVVREMTVAKSSDQQPK